MSSHPFPSDLVVDPRIRKCLARGIRRIRQTSDPGADRDTRIADLRGIAHRLQMKFIRADLLATFDRL